MSTPSDTLRAAAARIREVAQAATPGPWTDLDNGDRIVHFPSEDRPHEPVVDEPLIANPANGKQIEMWHPLVTDAVADLFTTLAGLLDNPPVEYLDEFNLRAFPDHRVVNPALRVARLILGEVAA
jgi:hypothetical protein